LACNDNPNRVNPLERWSTRWISVRAVRERMAVRVGRVEGEGRAGAGGFVAVRAEKSGAEFACAILIAG